MSEAQERAADDLHDVEGDPAFGRRDLADGHDVEVGQVGQDVEDDDGDRADEDAQGQVLLRVLDLAGAVGRRLPALIGPERGDQADAEGAEEGQVERAGAGLDEVADGAMTLGEEEDADDDDADGARLEVGRPVLEPRAPAEADIVDGPEEGDEGGGDELLHERRHLDEAGQDVVGEGDGQGRDRARVDDQEEGPAEEERDERAVGLAEVDVDAAGLGHGRAELGEGHGAEEAEQAADDPDREHQERGGHGRGDLGRGQEDARADDAADDDHDDVPEAQDPRQGDLGLVDGRGRLGRFVPCGSSPSRSGRAGEF